MPIILLAIILLMQSVFAQEEVSKKRITTFAGGLSDFKDGMFLYGGIEYSFSKHFSLNFTLHRDDTREEWNDGSKGYYFAYAPAIAGRLSWFPNGRGAFVQVGLMDVNAHIKVTEADGTVKRDSKSRLGLNYKFGYRWSPQWGRKAKGFFAEAVLTYSVLFDDLILQTDPPPTGTPDKRPTLDWHSWNNYKGEVGSSFLLGVGYTF